MSRTSVGLAIGAAAAVLGLGLLVQTARPTIAAPPIVSMVEAGRGMEAAGRTMELHGTAMIERGRAAGVVDLVAHGEHWKLDGQRAIQGGRWMAMDPLAPGNLVSSPSELGAAGSWASLTETAQAMQHDPSRSRAVDLGALRRNGLAMRSEGAAMAEHGRVMVEEVEVMLRLSDHGLEAATADDLRGAATSIERAGRGLEQNGQAMIDHADRLRRSLGYR